MSLEKERVEALQRVIDELRDEPGALMPIMQRAQDIFGYLPEDVQKYIAKEMDIPVSDVYGVATFYAQFNLEPKGHRQGIHFGDHFFGGRRGIGSGVWPWTLVIGICLVVFAPDGQQRAKEHANEFVHGCVLGY